MLKKKAKTLKTLKMCVCVCMALNLNFLLAYVMGMLWYNAYSFSFSFNIILHNLLNPTETTLRIIFIFYYSIAHCTLSSSRLCLWLLLTFLHLYILSKICASFPCSSNLPTFWLLTGLSVFFLYSSLFCCGKTLFSIVIPAPKIYCSVFCGLVFFFLFSC